MSWLPLYHDMGLIGAWLGALYFGVPLALMSPLAFLSRPIRWLRALDAHRGTLSPAPNFAFDLCTTRIPDDELDGLDLSSVRVLLNGSEAVLPETIRRFAERFEPYGLDPAAVLPVYGLAECTVGLAAPPPGRAPRIDRVRRATFQSSGHAVPAPDGEPQALSFVSWAGRSPARARVVTPVGAKPRAPRRTDPVPGRRRPRLLPHPGQRARRGDDAGSTPHLGTRHGALLTGRPRPESRAAAPLPHEAEAGREVSACAPMRRRFGAGDAERGTERL